MKLDRSTGIATWLMWHGIAMLVIVLVIPQIGLGKTAWTLAGDETRFLGGLALAYLVSVLVLAFRSRQGRGVPLTDLLLVFFAVFGGYFLLLLLTDSYYSRLVLLAVSVFSLFSLFLSFVLPLAVKRVLVVAGAVVILLMQLMSGTVDRYVKQLTGDTSGPQRMQKLINTSLYNVSALIYKNYIDACPGSEERCGAPTNGGGLSVFDDGYLLATGQGELYFLKLDNRSGELETRLLEHRIPINTDAFQADNGETDVWLYRVTDILLQERGAGFRLFAAYHFWDSDQQCSVLRISALDGEYPDFLSGRADAEWRTVYDSQPCLPVTKGRRGDRFKGADSGGRMVLLDDNHLLFSVGDYQVDGWNREQILAQDETVDYGKTIRINLETGNAEIYSSGHRNQQGLFADRDGRIWLTEHGPRGGDELNLVSQGANYGWPLVTYGTEYGEKVWPLSQDQGQHSGFRRPVYSWVPSIAVSNLVAVEGNLFPLWRNDLLVTSYKESMWRLRVREGRVVYQEPVMVLRSSGRIRDIMEDKQGRIVLWLDGGSIAVLQPLLESAAGSELDGQVLYVQCSGCHNITTGGGHKRDSKTPGIGPDLFGIAGSRIADSSQYSYSEALKKVGGTWTEENLDSFLRDPQGFAPGNRMEFQGIADPAERKKLIRYIMTLR